MPIAALCAAAGLVAAAFLPSNDPELAARAAFDRLCEQVESGVEAAWRAHLRRPDPPLSGSGIQIAAAPPIAARSGPAESEPEAPGAALVELFLDEVEQGLLRGAPGSELAAASGAALSKAVEPAQRAQALRAAASLALRNDDAERARTHLDQLFAEVSDEPSRSGNSQWLLAWLEWGSSGREAAPAWNERILAAAAEGTLALPLGELALLASDEPAPEPARLAWSGRGSITALIGALRAAKGGAPLAEAVERALAARQHEVFRAWAGPLPASTSGAWVLSRKGEHVIARRADESELLPAVSTGGLQELRAIMLGVAGALPRGYELEIDACDSPGATAAARRAIVLEPGLLCFTLRNPDQSEFVAAAVRRTALLRGAFLVLAGMCVVGGWATWRALVRERRLAELRTLFVANVSHELRTPLASILLLSENLASGRVKTPEQAARYHAGIQREALRLRELVDSVLDLSRLERGKPLAVERAELDLATWWASTSAELSERARASGATLELVTGRLEGSANVDGNSLRRAMSNLVDNALKHSGDARLVADADVVGDELVLGVRDHGRGIPAARREQLFEPFERLHDGPDAAPGTGLGLSIVRAIAVAHGGRAACVPVEPGARFELAIPLRGGRS